MHSRVDKLRNSYDIERHLLREKNPHRTQIEKKNCRAPLDLKLYTERSNLTSAVYERMLAMV